MFALKTGSSIPPEEDEDEVPAIFAAVEWAAALFGFRSKHAYPKTYLK
jgi:hypothetical protein